MKASTSAAGQVVTRRKHARLGSAIKLVASILLCVGCGSSRIDADAREYVRIEEQLIASMEKADKLQASGDKKGYLTETLNGGAVSMGMDKIRNKYKSVSEVKDAEFMQAVEKVKAAMR
jgi:hypothetical protein